MQEQRIIYGVTKLDRKRNVDIKQALGVEPIVLLVEKNILRWFGHVTRMSPTRKVKQMLQWKPPGKRLTGRPRERWLDGVQVILRRETISLAEAKEICQDQKRWRSLVHALSTDRLT